MLLTAVSEAVERYNPDHEAVILLETAIGFQVLILSPEGYDYVGGLTVRRVWAVRGFQALILSRRGRAYSLREPYPGCLTGKEDRAGR